MQTPYFSTADLSFTSSPQRSTCKGKGVSQKDKYCCLKNLITACTKFSVENCQVFRVAADALRAIQLLLLLNLGCNWTTVGVSQTTPRRFIRLVNLFFDLFLFTLPAQTLTSHSAKLAVGREEGLVMVAGLRFDSLWIPKKGVHAEGGALVRSSLSSGNSGGWDCGKLWEVSWRGTRGE